MEKRIPAVLCILLFACGSPQSEIPAEQSHLDTDSSAETAVETEPASLTQPENILEFLDGTWNLGQIRPKQTGVPFSSSALPPERSGS